MQYRRKVQIRRQSVVFAIVGTIIMLWFRNGFIVGMSQSTPFRSIFFGDVDHWPGIVKGFMPLDAVFIGFFWWLAINSFVLAGQRIDGAKNGLGHYAGLLVGFGSLGGVIGATLLGWYTGIELFLTATIAMVSLLLAGALILSGIMVLWPPVSHLGQSIWSRVSKTRMAQPFVRFGHYLNANDVDVE